MADNFASDFGTTVYERIQDDLFLVAFYGVRRVVITDYIDRVSFTFQVTQAFISRFNGGRLPLNIEAKAYCLSIEAFMNRPNKALTDQWMKEVLTAGKDICLMADASLRYETPETKEIVLPCRLSGESAQYFLPPLTIEDSDRLEAARLKRLAKMGRAAGKGLKTTKESL